MTEPGTSPAYPQPAVLCPIDFSESSRGALRFAAAIAEHFASSLIVMTSTDSLLAEAAAIETSEEAFHASTLDALRRFFAETIERCMKGVPIAFEAVIGKPDVEILRVAQRRGAGLIVMSSHGLTGFRKLFFGSTTERVLRETPVPVLVIPADAYGPRTLSEAPALVRRVLAPVLLPPAHVSQLAVVDAIAQALRVPALLLHVVEPLRAVVAQSERHLARVERERRERAEREFDALMQSMPGLRAEALLAYGEPSEEIVKVARDRRVGLIVMGLFASPHAGARIGSVTYRVLCAAGTAVLALPAGKISQAAKKAASGKRGQNAQSKDLLRKSGRNAHGTAHALKSADTRFS